MQDETRYQALQAIAKKIDPEKWMDYMRDAEAIYDAEQDNSLREFLITSDERAVLQGLAKQKYDKKWKVYMPLVESEYRKEKQRSGMPPSGLNRAQRRAMNAGQKEYRPSHAYSEKLRVRKIKAKKRARKMRKKLATTAA